MGIKERRINKLLALFDEKKALTMEEIKEYLQINERSVKSYISNLREFGIEIVCKDYKYRIVKQQKLNGTILSKQEFRIMKVILTVGENNGKYDKKHIIDRVCEGLCDENSLSKKTIERAIKSCEERGYIYLDEKDKYRLSVQAEAFHFTNEEEVFKFIELCSVYQESMPFYEEVINLKKKIMDTVNYEEMNYNIHCIGRKYSGQTLSEDIIKTFEDLNYRKNALKISYNSKIGKITEDVQVITLLYSWEKDTSYLAGIVKDSIYFINIRTIDSVVALDKENKYFNHKEIMDKLEAMFGMSLDGHYRVKVEFDNLFNIKEKIFRLHNHRSKSKVLEVENKLIYTDTIYGIYDFARYLRRFGYSCRVLEPKELRDIMRNTYERILRNYNEVENE